MQGKRRSVSRCVDGRLRLAAIPFDGQLLVTHQDALLVGGKVQAPAGFAEHVHFLDEELCERCSPKLCVEMCSGQRSRQF